MRTLDLQRLLASLALRNLWLYKIKSITIGGLIFLGTFLIVFGLTLLRNVETSMRESITNSVAGHIQLYSSEAKDELSLFGGTVMGREDIGTIPDYAKLRSVVKENDAVVETVPMGFEMAILGRGNELDEVFDALRSAIKGKNPEEIAEQTEHAKFQIAKVKEELQASLKVTAAKDEVQNEIRLIEETEKAGFWKDIAASDERTLQFLETQIAPLSGEKNPVYLRYLGTDLELYASVFDKFKIVDGETVPRNERGILISKKFNEDFLKNIVARLFDRIEKKMKSGLTIEGEPELKRMAGDLSRQHLKILLYLSQPEAQALEVELKEHLKQPEDAALAELVKTFLVVDDANFQIRRAFFYEKIAPKIRLYEISTGETIVLRSYTRSGYVRSVPLKVYGVYTFEGLEDSDIAGGFNLIDLVSFRELYGEMDEASKAELAELREQSKIKELSQENIEDALFGGDESAVVTQGSAPEQKPTSQPEKLEAAKALSQTFDPAELEKGLVLNTAVTLKNADSINDVVTNLQKRFDELKMPVKAVDWKTASGFVGQFVTVVRLVLIIGVVIILLVALVIINNSMVVATFDRTKEIGTVRAIGAQKSFVVALFMWETLVIGLVAASVASAASLGLLAFLGKKGIPATHDVVVFLFSGPRLYPTVYPPYLFLLPLGVVLLAVLACLYAARQAAKVSPVVAMQEKE